MNPPFMIERPQWYVKRFPNPGLVAGLQSLGPELRTDTDSVFRMTGVAVYVFDAASAPLGASGNVRQTIRFTRPDGTWIQKHILSAQAVNPYDSGALNGAGGQSPTFYSYFSALGTNIFYPAGSAIQIDLVALAGVTDALVLVIFVGTKLLPPGQAWAPDYSPASRKRPFYGYSVQALGSGLPTTNVPLQVQPDAGFVWQHGQQTDSCAPGVTDVIGPEEIAAGAATSVGSFFFNRPVVFNKGNQRFALVLDSQSNPWRLRAYVRNNSNGTWAEQDAGNGPPVNRGVFPIGGHTTVLGGYVAGSLVLDVVSTAGDPAIPFVGVPPFNVIVGNPVGTILAQLTVTGINSPTQFAVVAFGVDNNAPGGTGVFQIGQADPLHSPFCCPTYLRDPLNADSIVAAYNDDQLSQLSFVAFNLASKTWGAPTGGGPQVWGVDLVFSGSVSNDDTGAKCCIGYRRSDNKFVFNFQGPPEALAHNCLRPYYVTYDRTGLAWGTAVPLAGAGEDNPYQAHGIVVDPNTNEVHATVIKPTNGLGPVAGSTYDIWHVAIDPDDTIHPKDLATSTVLRFREPEVGYPVLRPVGSTFELLVPFTQNSALAATRRAAVVRAPVGIAPAWSTEIINADTEKGPINQDFSAPSVALGGDGLPYAFWPGAPSSGLEIDLWMSKGGAAGSPWGSPIVLFSVDPNAGGFMDRIAASPLPGLGSIGIVSFDLGNPDPEIVAYFEFAPCQVGIMKGIGVRIKDWQGKYYMNDFVPAELIFGFDNSQTPGLPYPEIYIPKQQALYLDLAPFGPINGLLTLTFKGMKVYE